MKHYFLLIGFLLGIFSAQVAYATQIAGLYQAEVDSATSGNEWQRQALAPEQAWQAFCNGSQSLLRS